MSSIACLERALDILTLMYQNGGKMGITEIAKALELHKSTVYRTLDTLHQKDFLYKDSRTGLYSLGPRVFMMGLVAASNFPLARIAKPHLAYLSEKYDEHVSISIQEFKESDEYGEGSFMYVLNQYLNSNSTTVLSTPSQCEASDEFPPAVYLCFLAHNFKRWLPDSRFQEHFIKLRKRRKNKNMTTLSLQEELKKIQEDGYVWDFDEVHPSQLCIAVPLVNKDDNIIAALSLYGQKQRINRHDSEQIIKDLLYTAKVISDFWNLNSNDNI